MKKIIVALDGLKYSESTTACAVENARLNQADLIAVFLDDFTYHSYRVYDLIKAEGGIFEAKRKKLDKKDAKTRAKAVKHFETACKASGISYTLHHDRNIAIRELLNETVYADLLIVNSSETLANKTEDLPTMFIRDLLHNAQCPVLLVPRTYKQIDRLILLYDGAPSSVHAIKMLSYTLPSLKTNPTDILTVTTGKQLTKLPDSRLMKEFMLRHFPGTNYFVLKGLPETVILKYLKAQKDNPLVVLGAYRRSRVSRWFHPSMADVLMSQLQLPMFIAHNK